MARVRVREVIGTVKVVDGDSLVTGPILERIVSAVMEAMATDRRDEGSRRRDIRIGAACCGSCEGSES